MAKKSTKSGAKPKKGKVFSVPVEFGNVNIGDATASLGITIDRNNMSLDRADALLAGHRLTGRIGVSRGNDTENGKQPNLPGLENAFTHEIVATFDCKRFGVTAKQIKSGMVFILDKKMDVRELACFSKKTGRLDIDLVETAEASDDEGDEEGEGEAAEE